MLELKGVRGQHLLNSLLKGNTWISWEWFIRPLASLDIDTMLSGKKSC